MEQWETKTANLNSFVTQLSDSINDKQAKSSGAMPSNTVRNPKSLNALTLRSGKTVGFKDDDDEEVDEEIIVDAPPRNDMVPQPSQLQETDASSSILQEQAPHSESKQEKKLLEKTSKKQDQRQKGVVIAQEDERAKKSSNHELSFQGNEVNIHDLPFPHSYLASRKVIDDKFDKEMFDMFSKVEVNLPLLELIKKMPKSAKFLKDVCTNKRKYRHNERIELGSSVSALFKSQLPIKCKDQVSYTIPCTIGKTTISYALLDLGAAINVMPSSIYESLGIQAMKDTSVVLQLADRTIRYPKGILEDI